MCLIWRRRFLGDHRPFDRIRRIKSPSISGQREETAQASLAMLQRRAFDFMLAVNLDEQIGRIRRPKIPQRDFLQVRSKVNTPNRFISCDRRWLAVFAHPGQPMILWQWDKMGQFLVPALFLLPGSLYLQSAPELLG